MLPRFRQRPRLETDRGVITAADEGRSVDGDTTGRDRTGEASAVPKWWLVCVGVSAFASGLALIATACEIRIEYDGWWHVFIARIDDWSLMVHEIRANAHPPLYFAVLGAFDRVFGHYVLAYRAPSLMAAVASVILVASIMRRASKSPVVALLAVAGYGGSVTLMIVANEVRSYMLAGFFVLLALRFTQDLFDLCARALVPGLTVAASLTLGVLSHYLVILVIPAFIGAALIGVMLEPGRREWHRWRVVLVRTAAFVPSVAVACCVYLVHIRLLRGVQMSHLRWYYMHPDDGLLEYAIRAFRSEIELLSPLQLDGLPAAMQLLVIAAVAAAFLLVAVRLARRGGTTCCVPAVFVISTCAFFVASVLGKYPFGGPLRHQFLLFPMALISLWLGIDELATRLASRSSRTAFLSATAAGLFVVTVWSWATWEPPTWKLGTRQVDFFGARFGTERVVVADHYSLMFYFAHNHQLDWRFKATAPGRTADLFAVGPSDVGWFAMRDRSRFNVRYNNPKVMQRMRRALGAFGFDRAAVFHMDRVQRGSRLTRDQIESKDLEGLTRLGRDSGLKISRVVAMERALFFLVEPVRPHPAGSDPAAGRAGVGD